MSMFKTTETTHTENGTSVRTFQEEGPACWFMSLERLSKGFMWLGIGSLAFSLARYFS